MYCSFKWDWYIDNWNWCIANWSWYIVTLEENIAGLSREQHTLSLHHFTGTSGSCRAWPWTRWGAWRRGTASSRSPLLVLPILLLAASYSTKPLTFSRYTLLTNQTYQPPLVLLCKPTSPPTLTDLQKGIKICSGNPKFFRSFTWLPL
jgi:hypothetical protein